jgi:hypothetical protein
VNGSGSGSCKIAEFAVSGSDSSYPIDNACLLRWVNLKRVTFRSMCIVNLGRSRVLQLVDVHLALTRTCLARVSHILSALHNSEMLSCRRLYGLNDAHNVASQN